MLSHAVQSNRCVETVLETARSRHWKQPRTARHSQLEKGRTDNPSMALVTRLADHFGMSLATLVGEDPAVDDGKIGRMFRQAHQLAPEDIALLDDMMQSLLKRRRHAGQPHG